MAKEQFPDWRDYEKQIYQLISDQYPYARIVLNEHLASHTSQSKRQIDICIYDDVSECSSPGIVECKYLRKKVDLPVIDSVVGKMKDVGASFAIVCSGVGFTRAAEQSARGNNIELKAIPFEFLKDYGFVAANFLPDVFIQETDYSAVFCNTCKVTNLYEIKVVRGFCETEDVCCPQCKEVLFETRTDGGHRVIKRITDLIITEEQLDQYILEHLIKSRPSWDKRLLPFQSAVVDERLHCKICFKKFDPTLLGSYPVDYDIHFICQECYMSSRTLLLDHGKL